MKRFHRHNNDAKLTKNDKINEDMHIATENYEKNSENVQKSTCIFDGVVVSYESARGMLHKNMETFPCK